MQNGPVSRSLIALLAPIKPFNCDRCGTLVRMVRTEDYRTITINEEPDPEGNIVPWPNPDNAGLALARFVEVRPSDQPTWSLHACR